MPTKTRPTCDIDVLDRRFYLDPHPQYAWLRENAARYRFYESWPPGNEFGMRAEPWHWQHRPLPRE